ncbi:MAG TPA: 3-dehydroquinate synthase, partial [Burkholderiales bacterium]|nr:3-dehydroquinate synthase [Burkholderiales bacterium]
TALFEKAGLPTKPPEIGMTRYIQLMELDKKVEEGKMRFVVLDDIGKARVRSDIPKDALAKTLEGHG